MTIASKFGVRYLFAAGLCVVGCLTIGQLEWSVLAQAPPGRLAYTVYMMETATRFGQVVGEPKKLVTAVRADGSEMTGYLPPDEQKLGRVLHLTRQRVHTTVSDSVALKTSYPMRLDWLNRRRADPRENCVADSAGRSMHVGDVVRLEEVGGYPAVVIQLDNVTSWNGLTLDCALLRELALFPDHIRATTLDRVVVGEPSAALFDLPDHYREAAPSVVKARLFGLASVGPDDVYGDLNYREMIRRDTGK